VGTRRAIKALGFFNTVVASRFIAPMNFGLVAMAFLVVSLTQALLNFGASNALLCNAILPKATSTISLFSTTAAQRRNLKLAPPQVCVVYRLWRRHPREGASRWPL